MDDTVSLLNIVDLYLYCYWIDNYTKLNFQKRRLDWATRNDALTKLLPLTTVDFVMMDAGRRHALFDFPQTKLMSFVGICREIVYGGIRTTFVLDDRTGPPIFVLSFHDICDARSIKEGDYIKVSYILPLIWEIIWANS